MNELFRPVMTLIHQKELRSPIKYDSGGLPGMTWYAWYTGYTWYQVWYVVYHGIPWFIWFTWYDSGGLPGMTKIQRKTLQCIGSVYKK